jgi:uncharacterized protein YaiI (UPF0178 family)
LSAATTESPEDSTRLEIILGTRCDAAVDQMWTRDAVSGAIRILVDADACPVKEEIYKVAFRHQAKVAVVSNDYMRLPVHPQIERVVVGSGFDAADDWIAEHADGRSVVVTADILLADRCLKAGATVIGPTGKLFTTNSIGAAIATRAIMADLRAGGDAIGGPPPFARTDRSRFLSALDAALVRLKNYREP